MVGIFDPEGDAADVKCDKERTGFKEEWTFCCVLRVFSSADQES
jgi:hypothetical protein